MTQKYGIIDVGSNSVRLMIWSEGKTLYKTAVITALSEGLDNANATLSKDAISRTALAVSNFKDVAEKMGADKILAFGTAALRAADPTDFISEVKKSCGITIEVISGEVEAEIGFLGAVGSGDGGMIDVGGASTEITVKSGAKTVFGKSFPIGAVKLLNITGEDVKLMESELEEILSPFSEKFGGEFYGVGGTATSLSAIDQNLPFYLPEKVNGHVLTVKRVRELYENLHITPLEKREKIPCIQKGRAKIIACGAFILWRVMEKFGIEKLRVSESDNLEGYVKLITEKK